MTQPTPKQTAIAFADERAITQRGDTLRKLKAINETLRALDSYNILCRISLDNREASDLTTSVNILKADFMTDLNRINDRLLYMSKDEWLLISDESKEDLRAQRKIYMEV